MGQNQYAKFFFLTICCFFCFYLYGSFKSEIRYQTEAFSRGALIAKQSLYGHAEGVIRTEKMGLYGSIETYCQKSQKERFSDRWVVSTGFLKKLTPHFTMDLGTKYTRLEKQCADSVQQWAEAGLGVRSDLLMSPRFYFWISPKQKQWCFEGNLSYLFEDIFFDSKNVQLQWNISFGYLKAKRPCGCRFANTINRKLKYGYLQTELLFRYACKDYGSFYMGPSLAWNSAKTGADSIVNKGLKHARFCGWVAGMEIVF